MADLQYEGLSDSELAAAFNAGDDTAFAWLYDRYFHPIYDFAVRTVRDADVAADVVQNTFVKAWEAMRKGKGGANVKAWLYAIARNDAIDELRRRQRQVLAGELSDEQGRLPSFVELDQSRLSQPDEVSQDQEMIDLVWSSAEALDPKDYTLLDLHVRRGLSTDELSECLGVSKGNVYTMLSRLRDSLESAVVTTLLVRRGRRDCPELSRIASGRMVGEASPDLRHAVKQHLEDCERCQENSRRFASPLEIFGGFAMVPAAPGIKESIWGNVGARLAEGPPPREPSSPRLPVEMPWARIPMEMRLAIGGVVGAVLAALLLVLLVSSGGGGGGGSDDPDDVRSTSHEIGEASSVNTIRMRWTPEPGARGYSVEWSRLPVDLPDATVDLPGDADGVESRPLFPGSWYFHMRTQGEGGSWTRTVHVGPFVIVQTGGPTPKPTPEGTDEPTQTPEPTAEITDTPTPAPAETATPSPTPVKTTPSPSPSPSPSPAPPLDTDADGWSDDIEVQYGSNPATQASTPENRLFDIAFGTTTCTDTVDNDGNGQTDIADPKCQ
jgi:RNA polymerase sigma-70 factor (ECF subfamily)